jgi:hypothetical protein
MKIRKLVGILAKVYTYGSFAAAAVMVGFKIAGHAPGLSWGWALSPLWISLIVAIALVNWAICKVGGK